MGALRPVIPGFLKRPGEPPPRPAVIDLGSNTARLTVFESDVRDTRRLRVLEELRFLTGLARDKGPDGALTPGGRARALRALAYFARRLEALGVPESSVRAATTSAVREAPEGDSFVDQVRRETGIPLRVVDGGTEADLMAEAQARAFPDRLPLLVADIGGGSTEFARVERGGTAWSVSLPVGSLKLAALHRDDVDALDEAVTAALDELPSERGRAVVAVAGTATTALEVVRAASIWDPSALHGGELTVQIIAETRARLAGLDPDARRTSVPGLAPGRADAITAGLSLLLGIARWADRDTLIVSDRGVRYGLLHRAWPRAVVL